MTDAPEGTTRAVRFRYTNHAGETSMRIATPFGQIAWLSTAFHAHEQWLIPAWCHDREAPRDFALADCDFGAGLDLYLVWSNEHQGWWGPGLHGYVRTLAEAGRYTWAEASGIVREASMAWRGDGPPPEIMVREADMPVSPFAGKTRG